MPRTLNIFIVSTAMLLSTPAMAEESSLQLVSATNGCSDAYSSCGSEGCVDGRCGRRHMRRGDYCDAYGGGYCYGGDCNGRPCNFRSSSRDFALNWCGNCGPIGKLARWGCPGAQTLCWCCNTKAFPDSGWAPPAHTPIHRSGGAYDVHGYGQFGHGGGGGYGPGAPMVYQPTDTTQLGYSYANVPTWQRNPGRIPPVPNPSNFHARFCPVGSHCSSSPTGCLSGNCMGGDCMHGEYYSGGIIREQQNGPEAAGVVSMARHRHATPVGQPIGLQVRSIRPARQPQQPKPVVQAPSPQPRVRTVSNAQAMPVAQKAVQQVGVPQRADFDRQAQQSSEVWGQQEMKTNTPTESNAATKSFASKQVSASGRTINRNAGRRTSSQRPQGQPSGGWFGLPSLREMTF